MYDLTNLSYKHMLQPPKTYIQKILPLSWYVGPTEETVVKFWQMVWEYQLNTIVMLTRCVENNKASVL